MVYRQLTEAEFADFGNRILYEDNHILVVNKKSGEITQGDRTGDECLAEAYKAYLAQRDSKPGQVFLGVPHRLDRPVCGICILAKTSKALERLAAMFREGGIHKRYLALCCAKPEPPQGQLCGWLARNEKQNKSYVVAPGSAPKPTAYGDAKLAKLNYRYLLSTDRYHLVEVELLTGRHHQIRCQLSAAGWPVKGDLKYGAPRSNPDGGICLQSHEVQFIHPVRKTEIRIEAPVPDGWKGVGQALREA